MPCFGEFMRGSDCVLLFLCAKVMFGDLRGASLREGWEMLCLGELFGVGAEFVAEVPVRWGHMAVAEITIIGALLWCDRLNSHLIVEN